MYKGSIEVAVAVPGTAVQLAVENTFVRWAWIKAKKVGGDNVGTVYVGPSSVDKTSHQFNDMGKGAYWEIWMGGVAFDLGDWWMDADNADDGVVGTYIV